MAEQMLKNVAVNKNSISISYAAHEPFSLTGTLVAGEYSFQFRFLIPGECYGLTSFLCDRGMSSVPVIISWNCFITTSNNVTVEPVGVITSDNMGLFLACVLHLALCLCLRQSKHVPICDAGKNVPIIWLIFKRDECAGCDLSLG